MNVQEDGGEYGEMDDEMMYYMILFHTTNTLYVYSWLKVEVFDLDPRTCEFPPHMMVTLNNDAKISELLSTKCTASQLKISKRHVVNRKKGGKKKRRM